MSGSGSALITKNLLTARKLLFAVTDLLDKNEIPYHLEGGTLLGIVRDNDLLPWDHDVDISVPQNFAGHVLKLRLQLLLAGYKMSVRKSTKNFGPIKAGDYSIVKVKPLLPYFIRWFVPTYRPYVVLDLFLKTNDATHSYWQAQDKVMRVDKKFHESFELIEYLGKALKAPKFFKEFLTEKYGDWSVPVKKWICSRDERTIIQINVSLCLLFLELL